MNQVAIVSSALPAANRMRAPFFEGPIRDPQEYPCFHNMVRRNIRNPAGAALANCLLEPGYPLVGFAYGDWRPEFGVVTPAYRAFCCAVILNDEEAVLSPLLCTTRAKTVWARMLRPKAIRFLQKKFKIIYVVTTDQCVQDRDHVLACGRGRTDGLIAQDRALQIEEVFNGATAFGGANGGLVVFDLAAAAPVALASIRGAIPPPSVLQRVMGAVERMLPHAIRPRALGPGDDE